MEKKNSLTKILAAVGTVLVWLPILAPILFSFASLATDGVFRFDYLMPAELGLSALAGGVILLVTAILVRSRQGIIGWSFGIAIGVIIAGQAIASISGLANGDTEPEGLPWALVLGSIILYDVMVAVLGIGGLLLSRDLFKRTTEST